MKFFAFIMSCIIILLSISPCQDNNVLNKKQTQEIVKATSSHEHSPVNDICSPLCSCNCCAGFSLYYSKAQLLLPFASSSAQYPFNINSTLYQLLHTVWQPPKMIS